MDGSDAISHAGPRSLRPDVQFQESDLARPAIVAEDGAVALLGGRMLVALSGSGVADLAAFGGLTDGQALADASVSADSSTVALLATDGRLLVARGRSDVGFRDLGRYEGAHTVALSGSGDLALVRGSETSLMVAVETGAVVGVLPGPISALAGNGGRAVYASNGLLHRLSLNSGEDAPLELSGSLTAVSLDHHGRRVVAAVGARLLTCTWRGDELRSVAPCAAEAPFALSPDGGTVVYATGGTVRIASFARSEPPALVPLAPPKVPRGALFSRTLDELALLAGALPPPTSTEGGTVALDPQTGVALYRFESAPLAIRAPPKWQVDSTAIPNILTATAPDGGCVIRIHAVRHSDEAPAACLLALCGLPADTPLAPCLLGGLPAVRLAAPASIEPGWLMAYATRWADGLVLLELISANEDPPAEALAVIESLSLEPWPQDS